MIRFRDYAKPRFILDGDAGLKLTGVPVPKPEHVLRWAWIRPRLYDLWSLLKFRVMAVTGLHHAKMYKITTAILDRMIATIVKADATPLFVYIPTPRELVGLDKTSRELDFFRSYCESKHGLRCLTVWRQFVSKKNTGAELETRGHWDDLGNRVIAEAIMPHLKQMIGKTPSQRTHISLLN
jgi:hypothetical protein